MMVVGTTSHPRLDTDGLVGGHGAVRLNAVLEAEEFPAGVTNLDTSLTDVDGDDFTHDVKKVFVFCFFSFLSKSLERLDLYFYCCLKFSFLFSFSKFLFPRTKMF